MTVKREEAQEREQRKIKDFVRLQKEKIEGDEKELNDLLKKIRQTKEKFEKKKKGLYV